MNPEHTVPTLVDNGIVIWDSHTICAYLVDKYAKDDSLYPKDLVKRARINQRLFFDAGSLFVRLRDVSVSVLFKGATEIPAEKTDPIYAAFELLEAFLATDPFLGGDHLTIADLSVAANVEPLAVLAPFNGKYSKINEWLGRIKTTLPWYQEFNQKHIETYGKLVFGTIEKNKLK